MQNAKCKMLCHAPERIDEPAAMVEELMLDREAGRGREMMNAGFGKFIRALHVNAFAAAKGKRAAQGVNAHLLIAPADQPGFHAVELGIVGRDVLKRLAAKVAAQLAVDPVPPS
jgi:hypothetical protein